MTFKILTSEKTRFLTSWILSLIGQKCCQTNTNRTTLNLFYVAKQFVILLDKGNQNMSFKPMKLIPFLKGHVLKTCKKSCSLFERLGTNMARK